VLDAGDADWPRPDEVFVSVAQPEGGDESLTLAESARLDRMDADIEAVIAREYEQSLPTTEVDLPAVVSASLLMRAASDPQALALDLARPMPHVTPDAARRGTAFHEWVAASHQQLSLIPDWDLAVDAQRAGADELAELIEGYRQTEYSDMIPTHSETEVSVRIAGLVVRGVIDAVFQHPDGTWEVVDWKTNREQTADPVQLAIYRLGWAQRVGVEPAEVRTAFVYVREGEVVRPALPSIEDIAARVGAISAAGGGGSQ
jgi:DNA helicase-2/ATP-dependent DNA helicase PcrA